MNKQIKNRLLELHESAFRVLKELSISDLLDHLLQNNPDAYHINTSSMGRLYDDDEIELFKAAKQDRHLHQLFEDAKNILTYPNAEWANRFKNDIIASLTEIKDAVQSEKPGVANQVIFLEHDYAPYFYWCGFGAGIFPLLEKPTYLRIDSQEVYSGVGKIHFKKLWAPIDELEEYMEEVEIGDQVLDAEVYQIRACFHFSLCLLLHDAFAQIPLDAFAGIPITLPLYIYGNEHDKETMNVYVYTK